MCSFCNFISINSSFFTNHLTTAAFNPIFSIPKLRMVSEELLTIQSSEHNSLDAIFCSRIGKYRIHINN